MPVTYSIASTTVLVIFHGIVTDRELLQAQTALFEDPRFDGPMPRLVDATEVTAMEFTAGIVRHIAEAAYHRGLRRAALVANDTRVVYGLLRMYQSYMGDAVVEVFRDRAAAFEWLLGARQI
jgi:hypothetical protein